MLCLEAAGGVWWCLVVSGVLVEVCLVGVVRVRQACVEFFQGA